MSFTCNEQSVGGEQASLQNLFSEYDSYYQLKIHIAPSNDVTHIYTSTHFKPL